MQQVISSQSIHVFNQDAYKASASIKEGFVRKFIAWCNRQEEYRFFWLGIALFGSIGAVLPITLFAIIGAGNNFTLWIIACAVNVPVLALNLAAQPPKVTLPTLFFTWLVDVLIIIYCIAIFFAR